MKSIGKRLLCLGLAGLMSAGMLLACGKADETPSSPTNQNTGGVDTSDYALITMLVLGNKPTNGRMEAAVEAENEIFMEKINAKLQLQYIEWTDWQTNYQLALASGDSSIDMIVTATDWLYAWPSIRKGAFAELSEDLLSTYAPQTWANVPAEDWEACSMNGSIWFIPEDQYTQWTNHGMYYRGDWAAEAGLDAVTSFTELETYFDSILSNHEGVIPWDVSGQNNLGGLLEGYLQDNTGRTVIQGTETGSFSIFQYDNTDPYNVVSSHYDSQEFMDACKLMYSWAQKGFWREDVLNYEGETRDLMYAGTSGADQHHTQTYVTTTRPNMDEKQPGSDLGYFYWGMSNGNVNADLNTHGAMAFSSSSKNLERALMMYDLLRNDKEIYTLHNLGIEGTDYVLTEDGLLDRPDGYDDTKDALDTNFWAGRMDKYEPDHVFWYDGKGGLYDELASVAGTYALGKFAFDPDGVSVEIAAVSEVCAQYIPSLAYGKAGDPEEVVPEFRAALERAGIQTVMDEIQKQLDELKTAS